MQRSEVQTTKPLHRERIARLVSMMTDRRWDRLLVAGNPWRCDYLGYASGFTSLEGQAFALIDRAGNVDLLVETPEEAERAAVETPTVATTWSPDPVAKVAEWLKDQRAGALAMAPWDLLPLGLAAKAESGVLADATADLDWMLLRKLPVEIDAIRRAVQLADDGYGVFREVARPGRREYEVVADIEAYFRSRGCADNFMILASGGAEVRGMRPPGERVLQAGDMVTTELTPAVEGYFAQICRTLVIGKPTPAQQKAFSVYLEALNAGIAAVRPGATAGDVARAENDVFRKYGLGEYVTSEYTRVRGHGLGLYVDGKPPLLEEVDTVLCPGMTIIVHPNTFHPEVGYIVLGDAVLVNDDGCEPLTRTPRELFAVSAQGG